MRQTRALQVTLIIAVITAVGPVIAAIWLAQQQGLNTEFERVLGYARDVMRRSDRAVVQMQEARDTLIATDADDPCSDRMLTKMRHLGLGLEHIKAVGYVSGTRMMCSTLGRHEKGLELGPVDAVTDAGTRIRLGGPLAIVDDEPFVSLERDSFIAIAHRGQALDLSVAQDEGVFATFNPQTGEIRTARGDVDPAWIDALDGSDKAAFVDQGHIVGVVRSDQVSLTGAIAAVPVSALNARVREFAFLLLPLSLIAAGGLTASVFYVARAHNSLESQIRVGLRRNEFFVVYQPVVDLRTGRWIGAEALLRWKRRDGEVIGPDAFIPIAERSGLIRQLTTRVVTLARRDLGELLRNNPDFYLSINIAANDLQQNHILPLLESFSRDCGARPEQIVVEVTEHMLVDARAARDIVRDMRRQGIRVAIDDFGTGYCSLSYLETMQFDCLKIDRIFVEAIDTEAATNEVVAHIIEMAGTLRLLTVAEGVETEAQARYLRQKGVQQAQGWFFGKPLRAQRFLDEMAQKA